MSILETRCWHHWATCLINILQQNVSVIIIILLCAVEWEWSINVFLTWSFCSLTISVWSMNLSILIACSCIFSHTSTSSFWGKHTHTHTHTPTQHLHMISWRRNKNILYFQIPCSGLTEQRHMTNMTHPRKNDEVNTYNTVEYFVHKFPHVMSEHTWLIISWNGQINVFFHSHNRKFKVRLENQVDDIYNESWVIFNCSPVKGGSQGQRGTSPNRNLTNNKHDNLLRSFIFSFCFSKNIFGNVSSRSKLRGLQHHLLARSVTTRGKKVYFKSFI